MLQIIPVQIFLNTYGYFSETVYFVKATDLLKLGQYENYHAIIQIQHQQSKLLDLVQNVVQFVVSHNQSSHG